jgi:hypothetical protein
MWQQLGVSYGMTSASVEQQKADSVCFGLRGCGINILTNKRGANLQIIVLLVALVSEAMGLKFLLSFLWPWFLRQWEGLKFTGPTSQSSALQCNLSMSSTCTSMEEGDGLAREKDMLPSTIGSIPTVSWKHSRRVTQAGTLRWASFCRRSTTRPSTRSLRVIKLVRNQRCYCWQLGCENRKQLD